MTIRQRMVEVLKTGPMTAREISGALGIPEREVYDHLAHVRRSLAAPHAGVSDSDSLVFSMERPRCLECGFGFAKRERLRTPGRCPVCRSEEITETRFALKRR